MDRSGYQTNPDVLSFRAWAAPFVTGERPLKHAWYSPKWKDWSCESLQDAYERFHWPFSVPVPNERRRYKGKSFADNAAMLARLARGLREAAHVGRSNDFLWGAIAVMRWGGVSRNIPRLRDLNDTALPSLTATAALLDPATGRLDQLHHVLDMNSGFSKVYSLLLDGFPIYDSRVACALASLVRLYCDESGIDPIPKPLQFGIPAHRVKHTRHVPGFPMLQAGQPALYATSNLQAAWLLGALVQDSPFAGLPPQERLLALQSALFMVGYAPFERASHT